MHQDDRGGGKLERALDHLARVNRSVVDGADLLALVGNEMIAFIEKQQAEFLPLAERHDAATIVDYGRPGGQHLAPLDLSAHQAPRRRFNDLELRDRGIAHSADLSESLL